MERTSVQRKQKKSGIFYAQNLSAVQAPNAKKSHCVRVNTQLLQVSPAPLNSTQPDKSQRRGSFKSTQKRTNGPHALEARASLSPLGFFLFQRNQNRIQTRLFLQSVCRTLDSAKKERA